MKFIWEDDEFGIGHYYLHFVDDNDKTLVKFFITDYTNSNCQETDRKRRTERPYSFEVSSYGMSEGFDFDEKYDKHIDENGYHIGGYQGVCTHTIEDIRKWCENYVAKIYIEDYNRALKEIETKKQIAEWFESNGYEMDDKEDDYEM